MKPRDSIPKLRHTVSLHIETLVLDGFAPGDRYRIGEAVQRELERLVSTQGLAPLLAREGAIARCSEVSADERRNTKVDGTTDAALFFHVSEQRLVKR